jgi:hypothetical protein
MSARFRHEDVESVPKGWKVRTAKAGAHRIRLAFPPGKRQKGSGRLVSVLHPVSGPNPCSNPCTLRSANPAELLVMGANPPRKSRRWVVQWNDGYTSRPFEKKSEAKALLAHHRKHDKRYGRVVPFTGGHGQNPAELLVMAANPRVEVVHGDNPPVEEITEEFTGSEVKWLDVYNEPHIPRGRYAYLAKLYRLMIKPRAGGQVQKITFPEGDGAPLIVSDATGKQIYFVGGNQDITACLASFIDSPFLPIGAGTETPAIGQARELHYLGIKHHIGDEDTEEWRHKHGEEDGALPTVLFDTRNKRLLYEGGNYRIEGPWIHN